MLVSIVTINLNRGDGLRKTLESIFTQTYNDYESIVIDGGSSDNSLQVIHEYDSKIKYWVSERDSGIYDAMNKGIEVASGEYCLFLNSEDYLVDQDALNGVFNVKREADLIYGNQIRLRDGRSTVVKFPRKLTFYHFYTEFIAHNCTFIKAELFDRIGHYSTTYKIVSDHEFFVLAVCKFNCSTQYIDTCISAMPSGGVSNDPASASIVKSERDKMFKEHFPTFISDYNHLYEMRFNAPFKRWKRFVKKVLNI